jgi:hypothetical protein
VLNARGWLVVALIVVVSVVIARLAYGPIQRHQLQQYGQAP